MIYPQILLKILLNAFKREDGYPGLGAEEKWLFEGMNRQRSIIAREESKWH